MTEESLKIAQYRNSQLIDYLLSSEELLSGHKTEQYQFLGCPASIAPELYLPRYKKDTPYSLHETTAQNLIQENSTDLSKSQS